jgi:hypothetical protein
VLLNHQDYPGPLNLDVKNQSLDRRLWDLSFEGTIWLFSKWRQGQCDFQWLPLQRVQGPRGGWGCLPGCSPHGHSHLKSSMVASPDIRCLSGGELSESHH